MYFRFYFEREGKGREGERGRQRKREDDRERQTDRQTDRQKERDRDRVRERGERAGRETEGNRQRGTERFFICKFCQLRKIYQSETPHQIKSESLINSPKKIGNKYENE